MALRSVVVVMVIRHFGLVSHQNTALRALNVELAPVVFPILFADIDVAKKTVESVALHKVPILSHLLLIGHFLTIETLKVLVANFKGRTSLMAK